MRIGIVGLGYVGLTLGIAAADNGVEVYGIEVNQRIKDFLKQDRAHFYEPNLDALIHRHNNKTFHVVNSFSRDMSIDAFVITVGTPLASDGNFEGEKKPNFDYIKEALKQIEEVFDGSQMVILRSTVSVGTTRNVVLPYLATISGLTQDDLMVGMCPERTVEGKAVEELTRLPQIVSGNNQKAVDKAVELFRHMTSNVICVSSLEEAELVKLYCNTYRDLTFALGNVFCFAAQKFGVDGIRVIEHANQDYNRSQISMPGFVAGPCLEKDAYILINNMPDCASRDFILAGRKFNESLEDIVTNWVDKRVGNSAGKKIIAISGLAFKGQPETSDLRGSSAVYIAKKLHNMGYTLNLHDFCAKKSEIEELGLGQVFDNIYEACNEASLLLVLNNNKRYYDLHEDKAISFAKNGFEVLDAWGVCRNLHNNSDIKLSTLGNININ